VVHGATNVAAVRRRLWAFATVVLTLTACGGRSTPPVAAPTPSVGPLPASSVPSASAGPPSAAPSADCVTRTVAGLTLEQRVGQLLMVGAPVGSPRSLAATVTRYQLGGVFLAGRSKRPAAALRGDIAALQGAAPEPLLVALDQEGGDVQTLQGPDFPDIPSALRLGGGPSATLRGDVRDAASRLAGIGVNINLSPVADTVPTSVGEDNPPIGAFHRQYGSDPVQVAAAIRTVVATSQDAGVMTTLKHFPGLGRVRANTDTSTKAVDTETTASDSYLGPFAAGIKEGSAAVMVSSASYPLLDSANIAAFSEPVITGLLRRDLGFTGLVMSDDVGAAAAVRAVPVGDRAVRFVRAGGDLVLTIRSQDAAPMSAALLAAARTSPAFANRVTDAATHVMRTKDHAGLLKCR
jgi:beta-N-acetylhexosaminidase